MTSTASEKLSFFQTKSPAEAAGGTGGGDLPPLILKRAL
jgi:hypothetical protein